MIWYEWKKLLFVRKGWLIILLCLIAEIIGTLFFTQPYDLVLENHREVYEAYLAEVQGSLTTEKRAYLENEMERLNIVHQELEQLKRNYYSGKITEDVYRRCFERLAKENEKYTGFSKLYSQYIFVRESEKRSFLYTGGWEVLLTNQAPDYLVMLLLIVLLTPVFCEEYSCRMNEILLTQKHSAQYQAQAKISVALTISFTLTVVLQLVELIHCMVRFGIPNGTFTLQSLQSFGDSQKQMTLWQAFALQFVLKALGYMYAAVVILFLTVLLKKYAISLMASIAILEIPFLTAGGAAEYISIPAPWALSVGNIYLNGGENELGWLQIGLLLFTSITIICAMLSFINHYNTNWHLRGKTICIRLSYICIIPLFLAGCTQRESKVVFNRSTADKYETDMFLIATSYEGAVLTEKTTGDVCSFPLSPLEGEIVTCGNTLYGKGDIVYYLRSISHRPSAGWENIEVDVDLVKLNLTTMEESVVFQWNEKTEWFFGLLEQSKQNPDSFSVELLFIHKNDLYYVDVVESSLNRMSLINGDFEVILLNMYSQDFAYDGMNLYYLDSYNRLVIYNLESKDMRVIDEVVAGKFVLTDNGIYFENRRDHLSWCCWDLKLESIIKTD